MSEKVTVLVLDTSYGTDVWICRSEAIAHSYLDFFVKRYWVKRMDNMPMPDDIDERRELYFEDNEDDWAVVATQEILEE